MEASDEQLSDVCRKLPTDHEPCGAGGPNCEACRWFQPLLRAGALDWGVCANAQSPRAGLLTYQEQGCPHFEQAEEPADDETWRRRTDFKDRVANVLEEALFDYADLKSAKANGPAALGAAIRGYDPFPPEYDYWTWYWDNKVDRLIGHLGTILSQEEEFDRRKAVQEAVSEIKQGGGRWWRRAPGSIAGAIGCDPSAVRVPDTPGREDEFWRRVEDVVREALGREG